MELEMEAGVRWCVDGDGSCGMWQQRRRLTAGSCAMAKDDGRMCLDTDGTLESLAHGLGQKNVLKECQ